MSVPKNVAYVVMAEDGEYSKRTEWVVCVTADRDEAIRLIEDKSSEDRQFYQEWHAWHERYIAFHGNQKEALEVVGPQPVIDRKIADRYWISVVHRDDLSEEGYLRFPQITSMS